MTSASHPFAGANRAWLAAGLFFITLATLLLEILDSRLLSVLTWYHLSFFAVSIAMLGMAAGAVSVFLREPFASAAAACDSLARTALATAVAFPISHLFNLSILLPSVDTLTLAATVPLVMSTLALAAPFYLSGVVVTMALTRTGARIGWLYGWDLLGAGAGALLVVPLLNALNLTSVVFVAGAVAAVGAAAFAAFSGRRALMPAGVAAFLLATAIWNGYGHQRITVSFAKNRFLPGPSEIAQARWNSHAYVIVGHRMVGRPAYWGPGAKAPNITVGEAMMNIDGEAATFMTEWHGDRSALEWISHDVTSLPYHLRRGDAGIIGVGGGRDILSAIWSGQQSITGIEINSILLDILGGSHRAFAGVADQAGVSLIHDEARSYLSRTPARFDVLQMSLIDTWAATGAGAFTLTENGLYTREGWRVFLRALKRGGIFSVSRWFSPEAVSEANRLLGLGVAALIDRHSPDPRRQLILVSRGTVATLLVSNDVFTDADRATLSALAADEGFALLAVPWQPAASDRLEQIVSSRTLPELKAALADPDFDYSPPDDKRPYFFNLLKVRSLWNVEALSRTSGIIVGNLYATRTLAVLCVTAAVLVVLIILWPLVMAGRPDMSPGAFAAALSYFALIGSGFMFIQVAFLERFSVLLGHPTYTFAIILSSMIVFAGAGSFLSDRLPLANRRLTMIPLMIAMALVVTAFVMQPALDQTVRRGLVGRTALVLAFTVPISVLLGFCFPVGMRLVGQHSETTTAWMWGVNGACGVLASVLAVAVSMSIGIDINFFLAAGLYALLVFPLARLAPKPAAGR